MRMSGKCCNNNNNSINKHNNNSDNPFTSRRTDRGTKANPGCLGLDLNCVHSPQDCISVVRQRAQKRRPGIQHFELLSSYQWMFCLSFIELGHRSFICLTGSSLFKYEIFLGEKIPKMSTNECNFQLRSCQNIYLKFYMKVSQVTYLHFRLILS